MKRKKAELRLGNGRVLEGWSFGYDGPATGEVVFSTSMVGYPESLTDPSFQGQILCVSYPAPTAFPSAPSPNGSMSAAW